MFSLYLMVVGLVPLPFLHPGVHLRPQSTDSPLIIYRLDDEAEGRADGVDILAHDLLDDGCLARIV